MRIHANAGSRHGNGIYSRPTTLHSQPNHTRRMSHTISTITITVPTKPKPNIAPPSEHIGHQGYPYRHNRHGFRLSSDQNQTITRIIEMGSVHSPTCCAWITAHSTVTFTATFPLARSCGRDCSYPQTAGGGKLLYPIARFRCTRRRNSTTPQAAGSLLKQSSSPKHCGPRLARLLVQLSSWYTQNGHACETT